MPYPGFSKAFILHTNASRERLEAVLYQKREGVMRVVAYASHALSAAEKNYHLRAAN